MTKLAPVCFVDCETTGLDPARHEIWEVGLILPDGTEHQWFLPINEKRADLIALNIGGYFDRHPHKSRIFQPAAKAEHGVIAPADLAVDFQRLTRGLHLAGAVPSFDADFLSRLMLVNHVRPAWHYHLIDVEVLAVGYLSARYDTTPPPSPPWSSEVLSQAVNVEPDDFERHTALGDARWAKAIFDKVMR